MELLQERHKRYGLPQPNFENRVVIIVDDGVATGATTLSALHEVRHFKPAKIVIAAPVASRDAAMRLRQEADEVVILDEPLDFYAVGQFYDDFRQVSDDEVIDILEEFKKNN